MIVVHGRKRKPTTGTNALWKVTCQRAGSISHQKKTSARGPEDHQDREQQAHGDDPPAWSPTAVARGTVVTVLGQAGAGDPSSRSARWAPSRLTPNNVADPWSTCHRSPMKDRRRSRYRQVTHGSGGRYGFELLDPDGGGLELGRAGLRVRGIDGQQVDRHVVLEMHGHEGQAGPQGLIDPDRCLDLTAARDDSDGLTVAEVVGRGRPRG